MANIDKVEARISESSTDVPESSNVLTSGEATSHSSAQSSAVNPEQAYPVENPISSQSTAPDVPATHSHPSPPSAVSATYSPYSIPHPKRFAPVTINKTFSRRTRLTLQRRLPLPAMQLLPKQGVRLVCLFLSYLHRLTHAIQTARPTPQPSGSHSKLVAARLTSTAQLSTTTGPGWSRPSSAAPPVSTTPSNSSSAPPPQPLAPAPAVPQLPHAGKVIQPQPRRPMASSSSLVKKESSSTKPAWGNAKSLAVASFAGNAARDDFPTAAEVAQGKFFPALYTDDALATKQVAPQEADAFRGVHLDPNAHHWDEMEEDDDNFLDNPPATSSATDLPVEGGAIENVPTDAVNKEDRFADDFDRSWPRSTFSPIVPQRELPSRSSRHPPFLPHRRNQVTLPWKGQGSQTDMVLVLGFREGILPQSLIIHLLNLALAEMLLTAPPILSSCCRNLSRAVATLTYNRHAATQGISPASNSRRPTARILHITDASFPRRPHPRDSPSQPLSVLTDVSATTAQVAHSPDVSHTATSEVHPLSAASVLDIEGVHKTAMHISAERAKQRRQLEEEEREKEKERAHKKAAELEERMKHADAAKKQAQDAADKEIIQDTLSPAQGLARLGSNVPDPMTSPVNRPNAIDRPPSLKPIARPHRDITPSRSVNASSNEPLPSAHHVESWRSKTHLLTQKPQPPPPQHPAPAPPPMFHGSEEPLGIVADESLEIVDFSELGKFVGVEQNPPSPPSHPPPLHDTPSLPARPVASDFFEDTPPHWTSAGIWEPKLSAHRPPNAPIFLAPQKFPTLLLIEQSQVLAPVVSPTTQGTKEVDSHRFFCYQRKPPAPFREVPMSALDDVMSRIKGALDDMQIDAGKEAPSNDCVDRRSTTRTLPKEPRWLPPALRPRRPPQDPDQEVFDVTGCQPPGSPRPDALIVKLPTISRPIEAISKRQLHLLKNASSYVRLDILSWNQPVGGRSRRDLSVNDILFKRPAMKGNKLRMYGPITENHTARLSTEGQPSVPQKQHGFVSSVPQQAALPEETLLDLDAANCSPPPELSEARSKPTTAEDVSATTDVILPEPSILLSTSTAEASPEETLSEFKETELGSRAVDETSVVLGSQTDSRSSEESAERSLRTPVSASFSTPWTKSPLSFSSKDSPARPPDPEHLKAVWSQAADKEPLTAVNSLEGIADDLTALPFTIQEVKSEDGETPPPTSAAIPSKISLHDVTRAFQQVPPSSNTSSHRPPLSPLTPSGPITRPSSFSYPPHLHTPGVPMRTHYAPFPSAHSPSPPMLYPPPTATSPIPRPPINQSQAYNQHMWVPMQTPQNNGAVRSVGSPFPAQMVAYPTPTPAPSLYTALPSHQNVPPAANGATPMRPRGVPLMSPIMHPAAPAMPMYNGSPVLMHPPPMMPRPQYMNSAPPAATILSAKPAASPTNVQP
ncbi:hypothetical protein BU15DRAFT_71996 [Melanogaster broomeanus]|nr:hypothetical protein BU15DRAFT_71996 [Melanogaster broomeanus]